MVYTQDGSLARNTAGLMVLAQLSHLADGYCSATLPGWFVVNQENQRRREYIVQKSQALSKTLVGVFLVLHLSSCISIEGDPSLIFKDMDDWDEIAFNERDAVDTRELLERLSNKADEMAAELEADRVLLPEDHELYVVAHSTLSTVQDVYRNTEFDTVRNEREARKLQHISLRLIVDDTPTAFSLANGNLYFTTGILDSDLPYATKTFDELLALMSHEVSHIYGQHIIEHWAALEANAKKNAKAGLALATALTPVSINIAKPAPSIEDYPVRLEYEADAMAARLLVKLEIPPSTLLTVLDRLNGYTLASGKSTTWINTDLRGRSECLASCLSPSAASYRDWEFVLVGQTLTLQDDPDGGVVVMTAQEQYDLCTASRLKLDGSDQAVVQQWLSESSGVVLQDIDGLSKEGKKLVTEMSRLSSFGFGAFAEMVASFTGDRAVLGDNCVKEIAGSLAGN